MNNDTDHDELRPAMASIDAPIPYHPTKLVDFTEDERQVFLIAFSSFAAQCELGAERAIGAKARGLRAVRWLRDLKEKGEL